ncbi:MAG: hypothetical protein KAR79_03995 [Simkaniaceae bacterium]|nr:hypothetical protein [Simkaniaceae bacterium]
MISDLALLASEGFIVGPSEDSNTFSERLVTAKEVKSHASQFLKENMREFTAPILFEDQSPFPFSFSMSKIPLFYSKKKLPLWHAASTWILENEEGIKFSLIQIKNKNTKLKKEILSHEAVHVARVAFEEPIYEEIFAYMTSKNKLRAIFGPLFRSRLDPYIFLVLAFFTFLSCIPLILFLIFKGGKLWYDRCILRKCLRKLSKSTTKNLALTLHLTDLEIQEIAKVKDLGEYLERKKSSSMRWCQIEEAYLKKALYNVP